MVRDSRFLRLDGLYLRRCDRRAGSDGDEGRIRGGFLVFYKRAASHWVYTIGHRFTGSGAGERFAVDFEFALPDDPAHPFYDRRHRPREY